MFKFFGKKARGRIDIIVHSVKFLSVARFCVFINLPGCRLLLVSCEGDLLVVKDGRWRFVGIVLFLKEANRWGSKSTFQVLRDNIIKMRLKFELRRQKTFPGQTQREQPILFVFGKLYDYIIWDMTLWQL